MRALQFGIESVPVGKGHDPFFQIPSSTTHVLAYCILNTQRFEYIITTGTQANLWSRGDGISLPSEP